MSYVCVRACVAHDPGSKLCLFYRLYTTTAPYQQTASVQDDDVNIAYRTLERLHNRSLPWQPWRQRRKAAEWNKDTSHLGRPWWHGVDYVHEGSGAKRKILACWRFMWPTQMSPCKDLPRILTRIFMNAYFSYSLHFQFLGYFRTNSILNVIAGWRKTLPPPT